MIIKISKVQLLTFFFFSNNSFHAVDVDIFTYFLFKLYINMLNY